MKRFRKDFWGYVSSCKHCKESVYINEHPAPNDIDIHGEAIAINCKDR